MATITLVIGKNGSVRGIHDDHGHTEKFISAIGTPVIRRASHVDVLADLSDAARYWMSQHSVPAYPKMWYADMSPSSGPVIGPFYTRSEALAGELDWLLKNDIPARAE